MDGFVSRFFTFDKLIATGLIKLIYWVGLALIGLSVLTAVFGGFMGGFGAGIKALIIAPIGGLITVLFWRFMTEMSLVIFGIYDRLGNIQKAVGGGDVKDINSVSDPS